MKKDGLRFFVDTMLKFLLRHCFNSFKQCSESPSLPCTALHVLGLMMLRHIVDSPWDHGILELLSLLLTRREPALEYVVPMCAGDRP